jgi:hypothetical protein
MWYVLTATEFHCSSRLKADITVQINVCDQIGTRCAELWRRPGFRKRDPVKTVELSERQISPIAPLPSACLTPEQLGDAFGDIEW